MVPQTDGVPIKKNLFEAVPPNYFFLQYHGRSLGTIYILFVQRMPNKILLLRMIIQKDYSDRRKPSP